MNIQMIQLDADVAKVKARRYARELRSARMRHVDEKYRLELQVLRRAYAALARGTRILDINKVFQQAGSNDQIQPRLAIARADRQRVRFQWEPSSTRIQFHAGNNLWNSVESTCIRIVDMERYHEVTRLASDGFRYGQKLEGYSAVPRVPVEHVPTDQSLSKLYTLWEVTEWFSNERLTRVDPDPYLLRYLGGPFYAVVAEWELTELERSLQDWMKQV